MTSILDQFKQATQNPHLVKPPAKPMISSGYVDMKLQDNVPMFTKQKMNVKVTASITHAAVCNDKFVIAISNGKIFRLDLLFPEYETEILYTKFVQANSKLTGIFLDPLGNHLLTAFANPSKEGYPELMYLHQESTKLKAVTKSRNQEITEVGWNTENVSETSTGLILLGTSQGHILETELETSSDKMFTATDQYFRRLIVIGKGKGTAITGLMFHRIGATPKFVIFVQTQTRPFLFIGKARLIDGKPSLQYVFHENLYVPDTGFPKISSFLEYNKMQFFFDANNKPKTFAWLAETGIFFGLYDSVIQQNSKSLIKQGDLLKYPVGPDDTESAPLSFALAEFHAFLMYSDRIKVISLLDQKLVYEDIYPEMYGKLKTIVRDSIKRTIWVLTDKKVFRYKIVREERNVWRIYSDKEQFDLAKQYCQKNPAILNMISIKQAESLFFKGKYDESAKVFAETQKNFETICLKFIEYDQIDALKVYLTKRLELLDNEHKTQISMIVIWMTELYLSQLAMLRRTHKDQSMVYHATQRDLEVFLTHPKVVNCMQHVKSVIYDLMSSHGDKENLLKLTTINKEYEKVVAQRIYRKDYLGAIILLESLKIPELFYRFTSVLMTALPRRMVNALMMLGTKMSPSKLLPIFLSCQTDETHVSEITRYFEFMVHHYNVRDKAIHNYLLTLYAEYDHVSLLRYLTQQGQDIEYINYDVHYALRLCRDKNNSEACVMLLALLGQWESAVELALEIDIALAKKFADVPDTDAIKKQLWLKIAEHQITKNQDLKEGMSILQMCPLVNIADILPLFSEVVTIDHFRKPICASLQEYNKQIEETKADIEEAAKAAEIVRKEINSFRKKRVRVRVTDECSLCHIAVLLRPFYLFPCGHKFHGDCLTKEIMSTLDSVLRSKLADIQRRLKVLSNIELSTVTSSGLPYREVLRKEMDDIIATDCIFCGEYMISCINKPFIADEDWDRDMKKWE